MTKRPQLRVGCMTRRVRLKVHGSAPTKSCDESKRGVKKLENRDRVTRKPKEK